MKKHTCKPGRGHAETSARIFAPSRGAHLGLGRSTWCNSHSVGRYKLDEALSRFESFIRHRPALMDRIGELEDKVLLCHCRLGVRCHADILIGLWDERFLKPSCHEKAPKTEELFMLHNREAWFKMQKLKTRSTKGNAPRRQLGWGPGQSCRLDKALQYESSTTWQDSAVLGAGILIKGSFRKTARLSQSEIRPSDSHQSSQTHKPWRDWPAVVLKLVLWERSRHTP